MPAATYVALGRIEHDEHMHEVSEIIDDLEELEALRLVAQGVLLPVKGASAVAYAQSLAAQRTEENISSLQAGTHQRILADHLEKADNKESEVDALRRENAELRAAAGAGAIHAPTQAEIDAHQEALKTAPGVVKPSDLHPTGTGTAEDAKTIAAAQAKADADNAKANAAQAAADRKAAAKS